MISLLKVTVWSILTKTTTSISFLRSTSSKSAARRSVELRYNDFVPPRPSFQLINRSSTNCASHQSSVSIVHTSIHKLECNQYLFLILNSLEQSAGSIKNRYHDASRNIQLRQQNVHNTVMSLQFVMTSGPPFTLHESSISYSWQSRTSSLPEWRIKQDTSSYLNSIPHVCGANQGE